MESDMQFMTSLFGGSAGTLINAAFALGIVLVMIVLGLWLLKVLTRAGENMGRGREKRLQIVDTATVDSKRKVMIIRRDNVEHVVMTGGPADLVIESGIARQAQRRAQRRPPIVGELVNREVPPQPARFAPLIAVLALPALRSACLPALSAGGGPH